MRYTPRRFPSPCTAIAAPGCTVALILNQKIILVQNTPESERTELTPGFRPRRGDAASVLGADVRGDLTLSVRQLQWGARCNVWPLAHLGGAMAVNELLRGERQAVISVKLGHRSGERWDYSDLLGGPTTREQP